MINACKVNRDMTLQYMRENGEITGRPNKQANVQQWQLDHPDGKKAQCAKETGIDPKTIRKWWK